ncbi:multisubunit potassium/proton antiporter PhaE subunit [Nitrosomonas nitrosa]|jgi:multicomponent K+:H+ antiporter subunit E|uniref:Multisubunit potassium/proton antiporter, PhaE subunit n=1 Tax=Nitrosomonas nitrosa TaxID=52442 RepID=A0A1I4TDI7_9PROT|nr:MULTISPECIES: Na+/H+ antiporter subunit E [Nitrosomonas]MCO6432996.1 Na+/H+ antiporter subunit E [Nitrosomonas nitrosa]MCW5602893.1 Na+/H+ antiporter subunit E [Nitrosomonas sp.]PTQ92180.1 multisubunit potassium/proton antiporter PhaE subunit [Nitrosomonas nitrosa]SFM74848.1 multisubunit potassium/proton antiporter, PhaE subunit [Nitrosomonas nitrosa]
MNKILPYPLLIIFLIIMWLSLTSFTLGQLLIATIVALIAAQAMAALQPAKARLKRWKSLLKLTGIVLHDIVRSNIAVTKIILQGNKRARKSGFMTIPLDLRDPTGLTALAIIITSTPGTAWLDYNSARGILLLHIFDLVDETVWLDLIKNRYERLLLEIFE